MTAADQNPLYQLVPRLYRLRDSELGYPLRTLLAAVSQQYLELGVGIDQLYDDWFIETCQPTRIGDFADLLGVKLAGRPGTVDAGLAAAADRRQVADALTDRAGKGSLAAIEKLAQDVTGWPVRAVETADYLARTASVQFGDSPASLADLRTGSIAGYPAGPFSTAISRPDLRRVDSERSRGHSSTGNLNSALVYLWRLRADVAVNAPAARLGPGRYSFDSLGKDIQLAVAPVPRGWWAEPAGDIDLPAPLHRLPLAHELADYYGPGRSVLVTIGGLPVPRHRVLVANLSRWPRRLPAEVLCLDPVLGRIAFDEGDYPDDCPADGDDQPPAVPPVRVDYARLVVGGLGADHDHRPAADRPARHYRVAASSAGQYGTIGAALAAWVADRDDPVTGGQAQQASIEILDDDVYSECLNIDLAAGQWLYLFAAADRRPVIRSTDDDAEPAALTVRGRAPAAGSELPLGRLDLHGLYLSRTELVLTGQPLAVRIDRCTLAPAPAAGRRARYLPVICLRSAASRLRLTGCLSGPIRLDFREAGHDPLPVVVTDSVLDAGSAGEQVLLGRERRPAYLRLDLRRCTVFGRLGVRAIALVADSIITGLVESELRQHGEVRYSYLDPRSKTPRRSHCQPELAAEAGTTAPAPAFDSTSFGQPGYARLRQSVAVALLAGAGDGGEQGAFHELWAGHRLIALRERLAEFCPPGTDLDIRLAT